MAKKRKKREKQRKIDAERNRGKVFCAVKMICDGPCKELHFKKNGKYCSEAFYKTPEGEQLVGRREARTGDRPGGPRGRGGYGGGRSGGFRDRDRSEGGDRFERSDRPESSGGSSGSGGSSSPAASTETKTDAASSE